MGKRKKEQPAAAEQTADVAGGFRDRIKELRRVKGSELIANPKNWRTHPDEQRAAVAGVLADIGYADALLARELPDGSLMLIDGHLRAEISPDAIVPVLIVDVSEAEADKVLLTLDPLAGMAQADTAKLEELMRSVNFESQEVADMLTAMAEEYGLVDADAEDDPPPHDPGGLGPQYGVIVMCRDEDEQRDVYEKLSADGLSCKVVVT